MGTDSTNIIEINGKSYDARTGHLVSSTSKTSPKHSTSHTVPAAHNGRSVDGIAKAKPINKPTVARKTHQIAPSAVAHKTQRPQTLMRRSVPQPQKTLAKPAIKVQTPVQHVAHPHAVKPKLSAANIHPGRAQAAASIPKSPAVTKYSKSPNFKPASHTIPMDQHIALPANQNISASTDHSAFFQKAVQNAQSHEQPEQEPKTSKRHTAKKSFKRHRSVFAVAASVSVLVIVGAFIALANMTKLELQVANMRAGMQAHLPAYEPEGYKKSGTVSYQAGKVTVAFKSTYGDNQTYKVTQQESDLNSSTLYDDVLASTNKQYQTVQQNGNTIYLYGDSDAAWVSGGILYQITGSANLSNDELLRIADSV